MYNIRSWYVNHPHRRLTFIVIYINISTRITARIRVCVCESDSYFNIKTDGPAAAGCILLRGPKRQDKGGGGALARSVVAQWLAGVGRVGVRVRSEWLEVFPQDAGGGPPRLPPSRRGYWFYGHPPPLTFPTRLRPSTHQPTIAYLHTGRWWCPWK